MWSGLYSPWQGAVRATSGFNILLKFKAHQLQYAISQTNNYSLQANSFFNMNIYSWINFPFSTSYSIKLHVCGSDS